MLKRSIFCVSFLIAMISSHAFADTWRGEFYNITPKHNGISMEHCKTHVLNSYQTSPNVVEKEILAENGLKAKDLGYIVNEKGGIFSRRGSALVSGIKDGRPWTEKLYYVGYALDKNSMEQGSWYTKDCKGFYKVGPM